MKLTVNAVPVECEAGSTYLDLLRDAGLAEGALGVSVKGATYSLLSPAAEGAEAHILTWAYEEGKRIYERSAQYVALCAAKRVLPDVTIRVEYALGDALCLYSVSGAITAAQVAAIRKEMRAIIDADLPITRSDSTKAEAVRYFQKTGQEDKVQLMRYRSHEHFTFYSMDGRLEYFYGEMAPSAGYVKAIDLKYFYPGMALVLPDKKDVNRTADFHDQPKLMHTFLQSAKWNYILKAANASDLNDMIVNHRLREFIRINEALHERGVQRIADQFAQSGARVILIAGPSSSGKTTFSHRLLIALRVLGYHPVKLSLDDYYINRDLVPLEADGTRDLERIDILDLALLNEHLPRLLEGETIQAPEYDFVSGKRKAETHPMTVGENQPIIIEGIHGLNDELTSAVPRELKFKIYLSALNTLNLDNHNRIRTTDARLLRRIVRDYLFRGTPPEETMLGWDSVRRGEEKYIFPYQEQADAMFNTTLAYELPIMKKYVYPILKAVSVESPCYTLAMRLVKFLDYFRTADVEDEIPVNSILREFIGGCCFYRDED